MFCHLAVDTYPDNEDLLASMIQEQLRVSQVDYFVTVRNFMVTNMPTAGPVLTLRPTSPPTIFNNIYSWACTVSTGNIT